MVNHDLFIYEKSLAIARILWQLGINIEIRTIASLFLFVFLILVSLLFTYILHCYRASSFYVFKIFLRIVQELRKKEHIGYAHLLLCMVCLKFEYFFVSKIVEIIAIFIFFPSLILAVDKNNGRDEIIEISLKVLLFCFILLFLEAKYPNIHNGINSWYNILAWAFIIFLNATLMRSFIEIIYLIVVRLKIYGLSEKYLEKPLPVPNFFKRIGVILVRLREVQKRLF